MQTDSLFYRLFQAAPSLFFELIGVSPHASEGYQFGSVEVKQTAFRIDGVFLPTQTAMMAPVYFVEVQFQRDAQLYRRLFAEVFLYLRQYPSVNHWRAVIIYPNHAVKPPEQESDLVLLNSVLVQQIYLDELGDLVARSPSLGLFQLIVDPPERATTTARMLVEQVRQDRPFPIPERIILELIETIVVYKFPQLSRQEIEAMLGLSELKQTRVYQEALAEGRQEGREEGRQEGRRQEGRSLILRLVQRRFGDLPQTTIRQINMLSLEQLEALGEALLDFAEMADLQRWLAAQPRLDDDLTANQPE